jgi:hypothetical protein
MTGSRPARRVLLIYASAVSCLAVLGSILIETAEDASIGGGLLVGIVALLGLPWSAAVFLAHGGLQGGAASAGIYALLAVLNAVLVLGSTRAASRRRTT